MDQEAEMLFEQAATVLKEAGQALEKDNTARNTRRCCNLLAEALDNYRANYHPPLSILMGFTSTEFPLTPGYAHHIQDCKKCQRRIKAGRRLLVHV